MLHMSSDFGNFTLLKCTNRTPLVSLSRDGCMQGLIAGACLPVQLLDGLNNRAGRTVETLIVA